MFLVYFVIIIGVIIFLLPWINLINNLSTKDQGDKLNFNPVTQPVKSEILTFRSLEIDLYDENYTIYLLSSARHNSSIKPERFIYEALKNSNRYYQYVIIKGNLNRHFPRDYPQFNVRVYDDGEDKLFDYTTDLINTSRMISIFSESTNIDRYGFYSKMHLIQIQHDNKKELVLKLYNYFKNSSD